MNHNFKDETGNRYGKLTVISYEVINGKAYWKWQQLIKNKKPGYNCD